MTLQTKYLLGANPFFSFNYTDFLTKTGYLVLYPAKANTSYILTNSTTIYTDLVLNKNAALSAATTDTTQVDIDFDVELVHSQNVGGLMYVNVPMYGYGNTGGTSYKEYAKVWIRKYANSTETDIASGTGSTYTGAYGSQVRYMSLILIDVPRTHFKKGDILRITIEVHGWNESGDGGNGYYGFGADPAGQDTTIRDDATYKFTTSDITTCSALIPFRLPL